METTTNHRIAEPAGAPGSAAPSHALGTAGAAAISGVLLSVLYLLTMMIFVVRFMSAPLFRMWFFSSDEYSIAGEVIRFAHGHFGQRFFDMPGTPFMLIGAAIWRVVYTLQWLVGAEAAQKGIGEFTFSHLRELFILLRAMTLTFYCGSLLLVFLLAARLMNRAAAWIATFILAASPIYASYSSFVRVESLSVCFILIGALILVSRLNRDALRNRPAPLSERLLDGVFAAGMCAGFAAATRLHTITASVPLFALLLIVPPRGNGAADYPRWVKLGAMPAVIILAGAAWLVWVTRRPQFETMPHAYAMLKMVVGGPLAAIGLGCGLYAIPSMRPFLVQVANQRVIKMLLGCSIGLLLGMPTVVRQYPFLLRSAEFYRTAYVDVTRAGWPLWANLTWYVHYYLLEVITPDTIVFILFLVGAGVIVLRKDRRSLPFLLVALLFFFSKPLNLKAGPHHVLAWLPLYAVICAYPIGALWDLLVRRFRYGLIAAVTVFLTLLGSMWHVVAFGPGIAASNAAVSQDRLVNVLAASDWLKRQAEPDSTIAISYYCFGPDIFYIWIRLLGVPVPASVVDGRDYMTWWGDVSAITGKRGYACAMRQDVEGIKTLFLTKPGEGTDPFTDQRFRLVQSFGSGLNQVHVFRFDLR